MFDRAVGPLRSLAGNEQGQRKARKKARDGARPEDLGQAFLRGDGPAT